jgi:DNA invertase Pin-like site-specific DNA recombinase
MARTTRPTPEHTTAVGYIRVSTDKQADHGVSLDAQRARLTAYAQLYDLELVAVIVDAGVSAKTLERPGLQRALGMLRKGQAHALLAAIRQARQRGLSQRAIVAELTRQGFTTRKGTARGLRQVQRIMQQGRIA